MKKFHNVRINNFSFIITDKQFKNYIYKYILGILLEINMKEFRKIGSVVFPLSGNKV